MSKANLVRMSVVAAATASLLSSASHGALVYFDAVANNGQIDEGGGTWNTSNALWTTNGGATNFAWNNTTNANDTAVFGNGVAGTPGTVSGTANLKAGSLQFLKSYTYQSWNNTLSIGEINVATGVLASIGNLSFLGTNGITKTGAGTLQFSTLTNSGYTGGTSINEGKLRFSSGTSGDLLNASSGEIRLLNTSGAADAAIGVEGNNGGWIIPNNIIVRSGSTGNASINYQKSSTNGTGTFSGDLTLNKDLLLTKSGGNPVAITVSGDVSGAGNLTVDQTNGGGGVTLSGDNTLHTGTVTIKGNTLGNTPVSLNSTQGNSNITLNKVAVAETGTLQYNINGSLADLITVTNTATLDLAGLTLQPVIVGSPTLAEYVIASTTTGVSNSFASIVDTYPGYDFAVDYDGTVLNPNKVVLLVSIPEPASLSFLALASVACLRRRRGA